MSPGEVIKEEVRYEIREKINSGNYGNVYKALQKGIERYVAIKELKKPNISKLKQETWIQGRLVHPNIATVFSFNPDAGYIIMEFVPSSLEAKIKIFSERKISPDEARILEILRGCLEGLEYAHSHGCEFHGDIKPGNILITQDWQVKITDFGVARSYREAPSELGGSEKWAAPETLRAWEDDKIWHGDKQSDLFSLGVVTYLLLTGRNPFLDPSGLREPSELILDPDYLVPSPSNSNPVITKIANKLLMKEPRNRYATAREVLDDLFEVAEVPPPESSPNEAYTPVTKIRTSEAMAASSPEELVKTAYSLNSNKNYEEAERYCTEALRKNPKFMPAYQTRGFARSNLTKYEDAIADFNTAISFTGPADAMKKGQLFYQRAYTKRLAGEMEAACEDVRQALGYEPLNPKYQYLRSRVCVDHLDLEF